MPNSQDQDQLAPQHSSPMPIGNTVSMDMILASLDNGDGIASKLNENHIDKLLEQRGDIIQKVHTDKKDERRDGKFYFVTSLVFALVVIAGVAWKQPEFLSEVIIALVSALGGYGYGYGKGTKKS